jgi:parallel beta-helix repeat protein
MNGGGQLYLWMSDSSDPTGNLVEYSPSQGDVYYGIMDTRYADVSYIDVSNITFKRGQNQNLQLGIGTGSCTNCTVSNVTSTMSGGRGISVAGNNPTVSNNTCSENGSEKDDSDTSITDQACIVVECSSGESNTGGTVSYNAVSNTRYGSCYEINGAGINSSLDGTYFHHNTGTQCRSGLELYGCYSASGTCTGPVNTIVEANLFSYTGHTPVGSGYGHCTGTGNGSSYTLYKNNICVDFPASGIGTNNGRIASEAGHHIEVYNNTIYAPSTALTTGALMSNGSAGHSGGNVFKNNIVIQASGNGVSTVAAGVVADVFNNNIYYGATSWKYNGTTYGTLSSYQYGSSQDADSSTDDPELSSYIPLAGSPAIDAGATLADVTDDYAGTARPQGLAYDIGAYETDYSSSGGAGISGGIISGGRFN